MLTLGSRGPPPTVSVRPAARGWGWTWTRSSDEGSRHGGRLRSSAFRLLGRPGPGRAAAVPAAEPPPSVTALSPLCPGHSVDPGLAGLLGRRAPRSKQPFMVTFFRASPSPIRAPRAVRPLRRRLLKKTNELPQPNRLPGIFGEAGRPGPEAVGRGSVVVAEPSGPHKGSSQWSASSHPPGTLPCSAPPVDWPCTVSQASPGSPGPP